MPTAQRSGEGFSYLDAGSGLPIVIVPGIVGAKEHFNYQFSGLSDHYRILSYDLRPADRKYSLDSLCSDLARFLDHVRLPHAVIAGHSFGSLIAQKFAVSHPQRCMGLVLISGAPSFRSMSPDQLRHVMAPGNLAFPNLLQRLWRRARPDTQEPDDSDPLAPLAAFNDRLDKATLAARLRVIAQTDLTDLLEQIQGPVLVIAASNDAPEVLSGSQTIYNTVGNSALEVVEAGGHFCFYTRHDLVNTLIDEFVSTRIVRR